MHPLDDAIIHHGIFCVAGSHSCLESLKYVLSGGRQKQESEQNSSWQSNQALLAICGNPFFGAGNGGCIPAALTHHTFSIASRCLLCEEFKKVPELADDQQIIWRLHRELSGPKRGSAKS
jgi:hypothetical protein